MLRQRSAIAIAVTLGLATLSACGSSSEPVKQRVRILATTDEHSHLLATAPERDEWPLKSTAGTGSLKGGVARRATVFDREKADGVPTVVLSDGDFSQGALSGIAFTKANFDVILMRLLGYDAIAIGNHEFDMLPAGLAASITAAKSKGGAPPFVLTNALTTTGTAVDALYGGVGSGKDVVKGLVIDKGGVKVGVVSALGPSGAYDVQYQAAPVTFSTASLTVGTPVTYTSAAYAAAASVSIAAILQPVVDQLRAGGAQVVVLLLHGGVAATGNSEAKLLVSGYLDTSVTPNVQRGGLRGVDLVVAGHTHDTVDVQVNLTDLDGRSVPVVQPAPFGDEVARAEFTVVDGRVSFDASRTAFLKVDDTIAPTSNQEVRAALSTAISGIEATPLLPTVLSAITRSAVADNPVDVGDLYFFKLGTTTFDVTGGAPRETNALNLDTDAMLATVKSCFPSTKAALQAAGAIRGDLAKGATGVLAFADVFRMVSLGANPDPAFPAPGFPLVHAFIRADQLWGTFERTILLAKDNNDFYLSPSGLTVKWNPALTPYLAGGPGIITYLAVDGGPVIFDLAATAPGFQVNPTTTYVEVVTTYQVAAFAGSMGITLYSDNAGTAATSLASLVIHAGCAATGPAVADYQALAGYVWAVGTLPAIYDSTTTPGAVPRRVTCTSSAPSTAPCP